MTSWGSRPTLDEVADAGDAPGRGVVADRPVRRRPGAPDHRGGPRLAEPDHRVRPATHPDATASCWRADRATCTPLGLEALAALLAHHGHSCRVLGARMPASGPWPPRSPPPRRRPRSSCRTCRPSDGPRSTRSRAVAETRCDVFYAGGAFLFPRSRTGVPGTYLGETMTAAAALIDDDARGGVSGQLGPDRRPDGRPVELEVVDRHRHLQVVALRLRRNRAPAAPRASRRPRRPRRHTSPAACAPSRSSSGPALRRSVSIVRPCTRLRSSLSTDTGNLRR